eukprot:m.66174 g.66174  ORF g.66174 m.66174 type:complete len:398 (-) comp11787_c0_seq4:118-1311(-)
MNYFVHLCAILLLSSVTVLSHSQELATPRTPHRLIVNGSNLVDSRLQTPVILQGFNWYLPYTTENDGELQKSLLPGSNMVRIVGIFWDNFEGQMSQKDCRTSNATEGFLKPECLHELDVAVKTATSAGLWVVITGRAEYAAGQNEDKNNVFYNLTLQQEYIAMWKFVASHFRDIDSIAAYEIMSEPRVKTAPDSLVADFYRVGCAAVFQVDPNTPCMIGPAPYYKPWKLTDTYLISNQSNIIYTVDFFFPENFVQESFGGKFYYPAPYICTDLYPGWSQIFCPKNLSQEFMVNKTLMQSVLQQYVSGFRDKHDVPVFVNQFGAKRAVGDDHGRSRYMTDVISLFKENSLHCGYWIWHWFGKDDGSDHWGGFEPVHTWANGTTTLDLETLNIFNESWS